jgi:hypothetical protein
VNIHDVPGGKLGRAVPSGIFDVPNNCSTLYVGSWRDTPGFAVDAIARWWKTTWDGKPFQQQRSAHWGWPRGGAGRRQAAL